MSAISAVSTLVAVALGSDLESGLDPRVLARKLEELEPDAHVEVVPDLSRRPDRALEVASRVGANRLVVGVWSRPVAAHELQAQARKAGLDPFALEIVELGRAQGEDGSARMVAAAVARLRAFSGSRPEELRLRLLSLAEKRSRRSLLTLPPTSYEPVAHVDRDRCLGEVRCGLCLPACPVAAIAPAEGRAAVDRDACRSCGICVTTCPIGATSLPSASLVQYEAELAVLLEAETPRLLFGCRRALHETDGRPLAAGWLPVEVPCIGMLTPGWILQALARGASAVALAGCGEDCVDGRADRVQESVDCIGELLRLLGEDAPAERVQLVPADSELPLADGSRPGTNGGTSRALDGRELYLLEPAATTESVNALAESYRARLDVSVTHNGSPLGVVRLREETCTACGACASVCPTEALLFEEGSEADTTISFEAGRCVACGKCAQACPEAVHDTLSVQRAIDLAALARGRVVLEHAAAARCRRCGRPIAPDAMLDRIRALLEGEEASEPLIAVLTHLCGDCRALEHR